MGFMAKRPRVALKNPYFVSLSRQVKLCPLCGRKLRLNGTLNPNVAIEVCDNDDCGYFQAIECPERFEVPDGAAAPAKPTDFSVIEGGR